MEYPFIFIFVLNQRHLSENEHIFTFKKCLVTQYDIPHYLQAHCETKLVSLFCVLIFLHLNLFGIITGLLVNCISVYSIEEFKAPNLCPVSGK